MVVFPLSALFPWLSCYLLTDASCFAFSLLICFLIDLFTFFFFFPLVFPGKSLVKIKLLVTFHLSMLCSHYLFLFIFETENKILICLKMSG